MPIVVATDREVVVADVAGGVLTTANGVGDRPTCLTADPLVRGRAWCGTHRGGVFSSDDGSVARSLVRAHENPASSEHHTSLGSVPTQIKSCLAGLAAIDMIMRPASPAARHERPPSSLRNTPPR